MLLSVASCDTLTKNTPRRYTDICKLSESFNRTAENGKQVRPPFTVELVDDCLYEWNVKVYEFDSQSQIAIDMLEQGVEYVLLNITFPENFPFHPPFVRVVEPEIEKGKF